MTRQPFDPSELGSEDESLRPIGAAVERYAELSAGAPPADLAARIRGAIANEPPPRRS